MTQNLFVYGTLRLIAGRPLLLGLNTEATFAGPATYQGRLYRIADYPGAVPSNDAGDTIHGEVYRLAHPDTALRALDLYEKCGPGFPPPTEYVRKREEVVLTGGQAIEAWVYLYNWPLDGRERIASGDFLFGG